jgi:hypothetical protein
VVGRVGRAGCRQLGQPVRPQLHAAREYATTNARKWLILLCEALLREFALPLIRLDIARVAVPIEAFARQDRLCPVVGRRFGRRDPSSSAAFRSDAATHAAYTRSVVAPPPPWPRRPATVRRSTPAESSSVAE